MNFLLELIKALFRKKESVPLPIKKEVVKMLVKDKKVELLYPRIKDQTYQFLEEARQINAYIFCSLRTFEEQAGLYAQGRTKPGKIVTNAKAGYSYHNYGLAFDIVFKDDKGVWTWNSPKWKELGMLGMKYGFEWGGSWKSFPDRPHFQVIFDQKIESLLKIYNKNNKLSDVWSFLDTVS